MNEEYDYVIHCLGCYWSKNPGLIRELPLSVVKRPDHEALPPLMFEIALPQWAECYGVNGSILIPIWAIGGNESGNWREVDWLNVAFWYMQGIAERAHEDISGPIHSYSNRLQGWDSRIWRHAWVNRIALFLRRWVAVEHGEDEAQLLGPLPEAQVIITHDVDAVAKTLLIRLKQTAFNLFNTGRFLFKGEFRICLQKLKDALRFLFSNDSYWCFPEIMKLEDDAGIRSHFNFYAKDNESGSWSWKKIVFDPGYNIHSLQITQQIRDLDEGGWTVGLHPSFLHWATAESLQTARESLESVLRKSVTVCRQHWLRFSWRDTWRAQQEAGIRLDTTLGFNDIPGFRNGTALGFHPWDFTDNSQMNIRSLPMVLMDSHLYDYHLQSSAALKEEIDFWIDEILFVRGQSTIIWHQRVMSKDYGWAEGFYYLLNKLR
jgi:hypothetical protein